MLSTQPYKGARDFFPEDMRIRNYIFDTWRKVCKSYGFEEYDGPFLEPFELYSSKTSDEIVNEQLYWFTDRGERKIAIRPEMTPTVSRMAAEKINQQSPTPLKWFSIANFWRYEKPQKGRGREFYQLNVDIFGEDNVAADFEILQLNNTLMQSFNAQPHMYEVRVNNRHLINYIFSEILKLSPDQIQAAAKAIDKRAKLSEEDFMQMLKEAKLDEAQITRLVEALSYTIADVKALPNLPAGALQLIELFDLVEQSGMHSIKYDPTIVRGFEYYDGNVFEQFDLTPDNNRSMFGGGRYDGLTSLFIDKKVPAVGFAPGDITLKEFLTAWNLLPEQKNETTLLVTVFPNKPQLAQKSRSAADALRKSTNVELYLNPGTDLSKQIKYADRKKIPYVLILGDEEAEKGIFTVKNLATGEQTSCSEVEKVIELIK